MENSENKTIKIEVDEECGTELRMFRNPEGKICVRLRDIDSDENVGLVKCPTLELAEKFWIEWGGK